MKKTLIWTLIFISIAVLMVRFSSIAQELIFGVKPKSGITIISNPDAATVYLNNTEVGKTPYENKELEVKGYFVKIVKDEQPWEGKVDLIDGTVTVINRDLSKDSSSAAGETLSLKKGEGITIISNPTDAEVEIDGKNLGQTPKTFNMTSGEHTILLKHANYLNRNIKANLPEGFNLTISSDLSLADADLSVVSTPAIAQTQEVVVKTTPTGFLRVREKPSTAGKEVARVKPGEVLTLLEEAGSWMRVRLSNNTEGYVSATYVEKRE